MKRAERIKRDAKVAALFREGKSGGQIARLMGITEPQAYAIIHHRLGLRRKDGGLSLATQAANAREKRRLYLESLLKKHRLLNRFFPPYPNQQAAE